MAEEAFQADEVPVGCVVVDSSGNIIGKGRNRRESNSDATAHAELEAIQQACRHEGTWHLDDCTLFVTLEPCPMCAGAIINSRIATVVYGAKEKLSGSCGSIINLFSEAYGHSPAIFSGVLSEDCSEILTRFFLNKR